MGWVIGSVEFLVGAACVALAVLLLVLGGKGGATRTRIIVLPIVVLLLVVFGFATILNTLGTL